MWKTDDDYDDHALFNTSAREEIKLIVHITLATLVGVAVILSIALK